MFKTPLIDIFKFEAKRMRTRYFSKLFMFSIGIIFTVSIFTVTTTAYSSTNMEVIDAGRNSFNQGHYEEALVAWNIALEKYKSSDNKTVQARVLHYKADAYLAMGKNHKAVNTLKLALKLAKSNGKGQLATRIVGSLGTAYMLTNRVDEARELMMKTIKDERLSNNLYLAAVVGNNLGNLLSQQGDYKTAIPIYTQAVKDAESVNNNELVTKGMVNISRAMVANGDHKQSIKHLRQTLSHAIDLPPSHTKSYILISIGRLYTQLTHSYNKPALKITKLASEALNLAAFSAEYHGDKRAMSYSYGYLGELNEQTGEKYEAMLYTRKALKYLNNIQAPEIRYRWQWQEARLLKAEGEIEQAINAYQHAVDNLQKIRHILAADKIKNKGDFRNKAGKLYMELADLLLKNNEKFKDKNKIEANLRQVRATVEMLKNAELEDYFHDDCVAALKKKIKGIEFIGQHTAAIYPIIFPDRLEILLSLPNGMKRYTVAVSADELTNEINRFRARLEKRTTHQYKRHAMKIYNWLIEPLKKDLKSQNVDTLVFIPDGSFRTIPITALYDGKNFLISQFAVATTPSLTLTHPQPLPRDNMKILVASLTEGVQGFPPLPNVSGEVNKLNELYNSSTLKNATFTQSNFEKTLGEEAYSIVHIASHGKFKSDVRNTFLLTYDGKINMDFLEKYMASTTYRKNPVELLTLSACQTAVGDDKAALGLGGIAVKAGARSALATLWYINDQASSLIIKEFYTKLKNPKISKAQALQMAQMALIKDARFKHPSYWAPFLLIGNWL